MNKKKIVGLWCRLESLYITKSLSNMLFMKKQLYSFRMKEGTLILQYLNAFNKILSYLLALEVKLKEEDKTLLLLSSLPSSYNYLATTIIYYKETLELEYVKQILQNNKLMKKTDSTEDALGLVVKGQTGRSQQGSKTRPSRIRLGRVVSDSAPSGMTRRPESTEDRRVDPDRVRVARVGSESDPIRVDSAPVTPPLKRAEGERERDQI